ncbi:UNVERIFIED_CONTAM: hypothetical protein FKN15_025536 [Acipenser sinensis]
MSGEIANGSTCPAPENGEGVVRPLAETPRVLGGSAAGSPPQLAQRYAPGISARLTEMPYPHRGPSPVTATAVCKLLPGLPGSGLGLAHEGRRSGAVFLKGGVTR